MLSKFLFIPAQPAGAKRNWVRVDMPEIAKLLPLEDMRVYPSTCIVMLQGLETSCSNALSSRITREINANFFFYMLTPKN